MHHIFFIDSSTDGRSGCSHTLAIINSSAVNLGVQILLSDIDFASVRYILRSGIAGSFGSANFNILRALLLFSVVAARIYITTNSVQVFPFLHFLANIFYRFYLLYLQRTVQSKAFFN